MQHDSLEAPAGSESAACRAAERKASAGTVELAALEGLPLVRAGDDLAALLIAAIERSGQRLAGGDVLVVAQKVVSKAEDRFVDLGTVQPSARALEIAGAVEKDPRLVEVILSESRRIVRQKPGVLIVEHRLGCVMANAGVDQSNVDRNGERVLLLPLDPDASALDLSRRLSARFGADIAVIINDSFGRPWRIGTTGIALGVAGMPALLDRRGDPDLFGRPLKVTVVGLADEIAAAASLVMGQADEGRPAVLVRGLAWSGMPGAASSLVRGPEEDLFR